MPENVPRVLPQGMAVRIDLDTVAMPPVFGWLRDAGPVEPNEMLRTFNCGIGMVVVCPPSEADSVIAAFPNDCRPVRIGEIIAREGEAFVTSGTLA